MKIPRFLRGAASIGLGGLLPAQQARVDIRRDEMLAAEDAERAELEAAYQRGMGLGYKKGGAVAAKKASKTKSASSRADGIAVKGKTRGRYI